MNTRGKFLFVLSCVAGLFVMKNTKDDLKALIFIGTVMAGFMGYIISLWFK